MLATVEKFNKEFEAIVKLTYCTYHQIPIHPVKKWQVVLCQYVKKVRAKLPKSYLLEEEDIRQELLLMWLVFIGDWKNNRPNVRLRTYLLRRSLWGIRDWLRYQALSVHTPLNLLPSDAADSNQESAFYLDLKFLLHGTSFFPLSTLSAYERYLIFLKFKEDRNIIEMSYAVQCDPKTVRKRLHSTITKLSKLGKESTDVRTTKPDGSCP